ncbi:MAG: peptidase-like [Candidatus Taylorbacteria bacterium]|nr:peptidase-like [Candidatus Taylorbacteria bacterium]
MNIKSKIVGISAFFLFITPLFAFAGTSQAQSDCTVISTYLKVGSTDILTSGGVSMLQNFLKNKSYFSLTSTGYFGNITFTSVKKFQLNNGIPATGFVGPLTIAKIKSISCVPGVSASAIATSTPTQAALSSGNFIATDNAVSQIHYGGGGGSSSNSAPMVPTNNTATSTEEVSTTTSVTITSPNGGETFTAGDTIVINWSAKNVPNNSFSSLSLIDSNNNPVNYYITGQKYLSTTTNSYTWKIPTNIIAGKYKLRVYCGIYNQEPGCGGQEMDDSDSDFTINATTTENHTPLITAFSSSPDGGGVTDPITFRWEMSDEDGDALGWKFETSEGSTGNPCPNPYPSDSVVTHTENFLNPGDHNVLLTVDDCRGGIATTSAVVNVSTKNNHELSILNPVGGENLTRGRTYSITWLTQNYSNDALVDIYLENANWNEKTVLANNIKNTGIANVVIPQNTPINDLYGFEVDVKEGGFVSGDKTDNYISITDASTTPYVTVLSPNGNESYKVGDTVNITWDTDLASTTQMFLQLEDTRFEGDIASHYSPIAGYSTSIPNTGSYSWTIPESLGNGYMKLNGGNVYNLTIANYGDGEVYDSSNNLFSIATSTDEVIDADLTSTCPSIRFDRDLTIGSTGNDVAALQNFLKAKGYYAATTGFYGSNTASALMAYKVSRGITPVNNYFGVLTRAAINADCATVTIVTDTNAITVDSPNGNEEINLGGDGSFSIPISWTANYSTIYPHVYLLNSLVPNTPAIASKELPHDIASWDGVIDQSSLIDSNIITPGNYYVEVCDQGTDIISPVCDISDSYFTLVTIQPTSDVAPMTNDSTTESITLSDSENESTTTAETIVTE